MYLPRAGLGEAHLLGRDLVFPAPHVDLLVRVDARDDEEHARAPGPACGSNVSFVTVTWVKYQYPYM